MPVSVSCAPASKAMDVANMRARDDLITFIFISLFFMFRLFLSPVWRDYEGGIPVNSDPGFSVGGSLWSSVTSNLPTLDN